MYSIAAGSAASAIGSGRVMARQVAVDAFGNALGIGLAEMSGRGSTSGLQAASGGFPLYAANQVGTTMNDAGPDIDPRPRGGLEDVTVTARRLGADDEVKVYYGDRLIQSFFDNTPTGRAVSGFGEAASAWIDRNRAEYNQYYDSRLRDASSPMSTALARTGRALSNAPFDLGAGAVGLYTLATDRNVQARTLSAIGGAVMNPVSTASGALGATRSYLANTSLPQMAEDVARVAAGAALTGGLGRLTHASARAAVGDVSGSVGVGATSSISTSGQQLRAIAAGAADLSGGQAAVLAQLSGFGSRTIISKSGFGHSDLAALSASTGDEFAMFTTGGRRLIVRGDATSVPIGLLDGSAQALASQGWRWSAHVHPDGSLMSSIGDRSVLAIFPNTRSAVLDPFGRRALFNPGGDMLSSSWLP